MARRLTSVDALRSWQVDAELVGGHTVAETLSFVNALQDADDERPPLPMGVISPDIERGERWFGFLRRLRGRE